LAEKLDWKGLKDSKFPCCPNIYNEFWGIYLFFF